MMKLTNKFNLPETFVRFDRENSYTKGDADFSVTEVIDSPRISKLRKKYSPEIEEDISDRIMSILGTAVHNILEQGAPPNAIVEERLAATMAGVTVSGQIDLQTPDGDGVTISDYKTCRAFAIQASPEGKPEWAAQLNLYRLLAEANGKFVKGLEVVAIIRDWNAAGAARSSDYPQHPVVRIEIPMWESDVLDKYFSERVHAHASNDLQECTDEERWEKPTMYAVHEPLKGSSGQMRKRATRVFDSLIDAEAFLLEKLGQNGEVQVRLGESTRCKSYCSVADFCDQYKLIKEGETNG